MKKIKVLALALLCFFNWSLLKILNNNNSKTIVK